MTWAAMLARYAPGLGDPLALPVDEFTRYCEEVSDFVQLERSGGDHRAFVEVQGRRMARK